VRRRPSKLPLAQQAGALRSLFPNGRVRVSHRGLVWEGELQPTPVSRTYTVRIEYDHGKIRPSVTVVDPPLERRDGQPLPHVFPGDLLCLHLRDEWDGRRLIAQTIVPWAAEWLLFYEIWLATGEWRGGGHEPTPGKTRDADDQQRRPAGRSDHLPLARNEVEHRGRITVRREGDTDGPQQLRSAPKRRGPRRRR